MKFVFPFLMSVVAIALGVLAFDAIHALLTSVPPKADVKTSYEEIVVVLLTTVTVLFTVAALVLGILAFLGPRAIQREAAKFAERAVLASIEDAMKPGGKAAVLLEKNFPPHDGPVKVWIEERVERQVISLLPLIIDRIDIKSDVGPIDPGASDDEGRVD